MPHQLKRLARRATHGIARTGTITDDDSGELFIAFTTANLDAADEDKVAQAGLIPNDSMDPLFEATVQATEEAILNALCAARTVTGYQGNVAYAITDAPPVSDPSHAVAGGDAQEVQQVCRTVRSGRAGIRDRVAPPD